MKWSQIWWRDVIWVGAQSGNLSELMKQYKIYLLHNMKILTESKIWSCAHIDDWIGLKIGGGQWYEHMKVCEKVQLIWVTLASTSFAKASLRQEFWKIAQEYLLRKMSWILAWGNDMDMKRCPKGFGVNLARVNSTCKTNCHSGQNRKGINWAWWGTWQMKYFAIFEEDMTQTIYENYLGIWGVMEI